MASTWSLGVTDSWNHESLIIISPIEHYIFENFNIEGISFKHLFFLYYITVTLYTNMKVHFYEFVSTMQIPPNGIGWDLVKYWNFIYFLVTPSQAQKILMRQTPHQFQTPITHLQIKNGIKTATSCLRPTLPMHTAKTKAIRHLLRHVNKHYLVQV